jgi:hypothetical protein
MAATETSPLLQNTTPAVTDEAYAEAAEDAMASAFGNVNASAFAIAPQAAGGDEETRAPEGILVADEDAPMRADLFIILGGVWVGSTCIPRRSLRRDTQRLM